MDAREVELAMAYADRTIGPLPLADADERVLQWLTNPVDTVWRLYAFDKLREHASEDTLVMDASRLPGSSCPGNAFIWHRQGVRRHHIRGAPARQGGGCTACCWGQSAASLAGELNIQLHEAQHFTAQFKRYPESVSCLTEIEVQIIRIYDAA